MRGALAPPLEGRIGMLHWQVYDHVMLIRIVAGLFTRAGGDGFTREAQRKGGRESARRRALLAPTSTRRPHRRKLFVRREAAG